MNWKRWKNISIFFWIKNGFIIPPILQKPRYCSYFKKNSNLRFCVDYRGLKKITVKNRHFFPLINETLDRFNGFKIFIKLDLKNAYHRIQIRKSDKWKTAFRTRDGHFEYTVMFFELNNIPVIIEIYVIKFFVKLIDEFCVVYFDNIFIYSKTRIKHIRHVKKILKRIKNFNLYVNQIKNVFFTTEFFFFGIHGIYRWRVNG